PSGGSSRSPRPLAGEPPHGSLSRVVLRTTGLKREAATKWRYRRHAMARRHRLNVVGDFYVVDGCCTRCGVTWAIAPHLFQDTPEGCFVKKQPANPGELDAMIEVLAVQDLDCVRYSGRDPVVLDA